MGRLIPEDVIQTAEYSFRKFMESPLMQRWMQLNAAYIAAASDARLLAGMTHLRNSSLLLGSAELVLTLGVPIGVWVGVFAAMGAPYMEARAVVTHENFQSGFSQGFVCGILKWEWRHAVSRFGKFSAGRLNDFDESLSFMGANSYNDGLRAGFTHATLLAEDARKALVSRLKSLSPYSSLGNWDRRDQVAYVVELATAGRRHYVFRPH